MSVPKLEKLMGIEAYATRSQGVGGVIRRSVDDFVVEEVLVDGSKAEIDPSSSVVKHAVLGSSNLRNRYLLCVLVKRNWDTLSAVKAVADQLGISMGRIQAGGMKDAKAVTAQHMTIEGVSPEDLQKVHVKDMELRPLGYFRNELASYYLLGNSFHITINSVNHSLSTVEKRIAQTVEELRSIGGVPNFFGHQRFGTTRSITHLVGKAIVKGNFKKAAMIFMAKPSPHEHPNSREAREKLQATQDFEKALNDFPRQLRYERLLLKHLADRHDDYAGAFRRLPRKLQELFVQAYQSYLFNKFLSRRMAVGLRLDRAEVGDFVVNVERSGLPMPKMHRVASEEKLAELNMEMKAGKMRLALPLVGFRQAPSTEVQGEIERQILKEENLQLESFRVKELPEVMARGELRATTVPLNDFSVDEISCDPADRSRCKVKISFMLHRGSYATVFLREIMKPHNLIGAGF